MSKSRLESLKGLLADNPNDSFVHYGLAHEYYKLNEHEDAVRHIEAYLQIADDEGAGYRILGHSLLQLGRREDARKAFERGITAAERHAHPSMAEEFQETIELEFE